nr:hypothetical protein [Tanacetum cinerariifolium]
KTAKQHKSLTNLNHKNYHTIKDDGIISRLKFIRIGEDYQEYGLPIPDVMLTDATNHSESYQMFIKYLTNQIPPKKSKGKGLKDIMQALKKSKKTSRRQPGSGDSNKGTGSKPGVLDESTVIFATSSEGTCAK